MLTGVHEYRKVAAWVVKNASSRSCSLLQRNLHAFWEYCTSETTPAVYPSSPNICVSKASSTSYGAITNGCACEKGDNTSEITQANSFLQWYREGLHAELLDEWSGEYKFILLERMRSASYWPYFKQLYKILLFHTVGRLVLQNAFCKYPCRVNALAQVDISVSVHNILTNLWIRDNSVAESASNAVMRCAMHPESWIPEKTSQSHFTTASRLLPVLVAQVDSGYDFRVMLTTVVLVLRQKIIIMQSSFKSADFYTQVTF